MTSLEKQEINRVIAEAMGWKFDLKKGIAISPDTRDFPKDLPNPYTSIQGVFEAVDVIIGDKNASLTFYFNLPSNKYVCNLDVNFNGAWEGRSDETPQAAATLALYKFIKEK